MARRCGVSGKGVQAGNNVSHAHNKTRRRFLPNLQTVSLMSEVLGRTVRLRLAANTLRTIEHKGGLDAYLMGASGSKLTVEASKIKKQIKKAQEKTAA